MSNIVFASAFVVSFILSWGFTLLLKRIAKKAKIMDQPDEKRKIHLKPVPLLGGLAIFLSFNATVFFYVLQSGAQMENLILKNLLGILFGGLWLMIGGVLDDKYNLKPKYQILFPFLAIFTVIAAGIGIDWITNPFSHGLLYLNKYVVPFFWYKGVLYKITLIADLLTVVWLLAMIYTTKLLDGLDGLVSGVTVIGSLFIFFTAMTKEIPQYDVALLSLILAGAFLAFWFFNFYPAAIFLGEGGSTFAGFMLGALAIAAGSKIAVTLMLMGLPLIDLVWTVVRRMARGKSPFKSADKKHLHHRLLEFGLTHRQAVLVFYLAVILLGSVGLLLQA